VNWLVKNISWVALIGVIFASGGYVYQISAQGEDIKEVKGEVKKVNEKAIHLENFATAQRAYNVHIDEKTDMHYEHLKDSNIALRELIKALKE